MAEPSDQVMENEVVSVAEAVETEPRVALEEAVRKVGVRIVAPEVRLEEVAKSQESARPPKVEVVVHEVEDDVVSVVSMPGGKRRGVVESEGSENDGVEEARPVVPMGPRGGVPVGPAAMVGGRRVPEGPRGRTRFRYEEVNRYRFVDWTLLGQRSGIVDDTYHTRGDRACALGRGKMRGGRGFFFSYR